MGFVIFGWFLSLAALLAAATLWGVDPAPLPPAIRNAKTAYIVNQTEDYKLYDNLYDRLRKWGQWTLTEDRASADLVLVFAARDEFFGMLPGTTTVTSSGNTAAITSVPIPVVTMSRYLIVLDAKTEDKLMSISCERRIGSGYTAGVLVNRLKQRFPKRTSKE